MSRQPWDTPAWANLLDSHASALRLNASQRGQLDQAMRAAVRQALADPEFVRKLTLGILEAMAER